MTNPNDPAFSDKEIFVGIGANNETISKTVGLTKREYFAAMAMQGLVSGRYASGERELFDTTQQVISTEAVGLANALIKELSK